MSYENPPLPSGLTLLPQTRVTPPMARWALQIDEDPRSYPLSSITVQTFDGLRVAARVEWHYVHYAGGITYRYPPNGPWWGVTLYDATDYDESNAPTVPSPAELPLEGVDVSQYQGAVDWTAVAQAGKGFAFVRASDGAAHRDAAFEANWAQRSVPRGVYQLFRPAVDVEAQTTLLTSMVAGDWGELAPVVDVEVLDGVPPAALAGRLTEWIVRVADASGRVPMVYCAPGFWSQLPDVGIGQHAALWVAQWNVPRPTIPHGWGGYAVWQYATNSRVPGIPTPVDLDRLAGTALPKGGT